jgi:hypothetical protein
MASTILILLQGARLWSAPKRRSWNGPPAVTKRGKLGTLLAGKVARHPILKRVTGIPPTPPRQQKAPQFDGTFTTATSTMNFSFTFQPRFGGDIDFTVKLPSLIPPSNTVTGFFERRVGTDRPGAFEPGADRRRYPWSSGPHPSQDYEVSPNSDVHWVETRAEAELLRPFSRFRTRLHQQIAMSATEARAQTIPAACMVEIRSFNSTRASTTVLAG